MTDITPAPTRIVVDEVINLPWLPVEPLDEGVRPRQAWEMGKVAEGSLSEKGVEWAAAQGPVTTRGTYLSAVRGFCLFVAGGDEDRARGVPMQALTKATLMAYREFLENGDPLAEPPVPARAPATVAKIFSALRGLAAEESVQLGTLKTKSAPRRLPTPIPEHQYQLALKVASGRIHEASGGKARRLSEAAVRAYRDRALLRLLGDCGLRRSEAIELQIADITQIERGEARLRIAGAGGSERNATRWWVHVRAGKRGKERSVPIPADVYEDLTAWFRARHQVYDSPHGPLLLAAPTFNEKQDAWRPLTVRQLYNIVSEHTEAAGATGKATRPHALRHRYCTFLARRGVPIETIRELAGHADIRTTQLYVQISNDQLEHAVAGAFEEDLPEFARAAMLDAA